MREYVISIIFFLFLLVPADLRATVAEEQELDGLLTEAGGINGFLSDEAAQEAYWELLLQHQNVPEKVFPFELFHDFMTQTSWMIRAIPDFESRLMKDSGMGERIEIQTYKASPSKNPLSPLDGLLQWWNSIQALAKKHEDLSSVKRLGREHTLKAELETKLREFSAMSKSKGDVARGLYYENLWQEEGFRSFAASTIQSHLRSLKFHEALQSRDVDGAYDLLEKARTSSWSNFPPLALSLLRKMIPSRDRSEFPLDTKYELIPVVRKFHAIAKGVKFFECIGGCLSYPQDLTPRRWATVLVKDTQFYEVYQNGEYIGFIQIVPILSKDGTETFGSIDVVVPNMDLSVYLLDKDGKLREERLIDTVLSRLYAKLPSSWAGMVKSESDSIHNGGALNALYGSKAYRFGTPIGVTQDEFIFSDVSFAAEVANHAKPTPHMADSFNGNYLVFDAASQGEGTLRLLARPNEMSFDTVEQMQDLLGNADPSSHPRIFVAFLELAKDTPKIRAFLTKIYGKTSEEARASILKNLQFYASKGCITGNSLLDIVIADKDTLFQLFDFQVKDDWPLRKTWRIRSRVRMAHLYERYTGTFIYENGNSIENCIVYREEMLPMVRTARGFIDVVRTRLKQPNNDYFCAISKFAVDHIKKFASLHPTLQEVRDLCEVVWSIDAGIAARKAVIGRVKNQKEFIELVQSELEESSENYLKALDALARENLDTFFSFKPSLRDVNALLKVYPKGSMAEEVVRRLVDDPIPIKDEDLIEKVRELSRNLGIVANAIGIRRAYIRFIKTPQQFIEMMKSEVLPATKEYLEALDVLASENIALFFSLNPSPTIQDVQALLDLYPSGPTAREGVSRLITHPIPIEEGTIVSVAHQICKKLNHIPHCIGIRRAYAPLVKTPDQFIELMQPGFPKPNEAYLGELEKLAVEFLPTLFGMQPPPTIDQAKQVVLLMQNLANGITVHRLAIQHAVRSAEDYMKAVTIEMRPASPKYHNAMDTLIAETFDKFLSYTPSVSQVKEVLQKCTSLESSIELRRKFLTSNRVLSIDDFIDVMRTERHSRKSRHAFLKLARDLVPIREKLKFTSEDDARLADALNRSHVDLRRILKFTCRNLLEMWKKTGLVMK